MSFTHTFKKTDSHGSRYRRGSEDDGGNRSQIKTINGLKDDLPVVNFFRLP